jgi:transposase
MLLTHRKLLQSKTIAIENDLRGTLRNFGLKVGMVGKVKFEARIQELVETFPDLAALVEPLLMVRRALREQIVILHRRLLAIVRDDEVCRHMARERAQRISRLAGRRRDRVPLALVAEMQERHEHKREGGEGRR